MEGFTILIPLAPFLMVAALVLVPRYYRNRERLEMQQTVRAAIDRGQPLPPELIEAMTKDVPTPVSARVKSARNDLRAGVVWLAVGLGVAAFAYAIGWEEREAVAPMLGLACIPIFIGLALIGLGLVGPKDRPMDRGAI